MSDYYKELGSKLNREQLYKKALELVECERKSYGYVYDNYDIQENRYSDGWNNCLDEVASMILDMINGGKW